LETTSGRAGGHCRCPRGNGEEVVGRRGMGSPARRKTKSAAPLCSPSTSTEMDRSRGVAMGRCAAWRSEVGFIGNGEGAGFGRKMWEGGNAVRQLSVLPRSSISPPRSALPRSEYEIPSVATFFSTQERGN
jgi:hypothetical protein